LSEGNRYEKERKEEDWDATKGYQLKPDEIMDGII